MMHPHAAVVYVRTQFKESPEGINNGRCDEFADRLYELLPGSVVHVSEEYETDWPEIPYHIWVEYLGKHYDAETPDGVDNWMDLPLFKSCPVCRSCGKRHLGDPYAEPRRRQRFVAVRSYRRRR